jgi:hypothetical protein
MRHTGMGMSIGAREARDELYRDAGEQIEVKPGEFTAIPYYASSNRGPSPFVVWTPEWPELEEPLA